MVYGQNKSMRLFNCIKYKNNKIDKRKFKT